MQGAPRSTELRVGELPQPGGVEHTLAGQELAERAEEQRLDDVRQLVHERGRRPFHRGRHADVAAEQHAGDHVEDVERAERDAEERVVAVEQEPVDGGGREYEDRPSDRCAQERRPQASPRDTEERSGDAQRTIGEHARGGEPHRRSIGEEGPALLSEVSRSSRAARTRARACARCRPRRSGP
jgi:hypothetical protein